MTAVESWLLAYLLNSLWQVPLVFAAAWLASRLARRAGPAVEHRVWAAAVVLMALLPACRFRIDELWQHAWSLVLWLRSGPAPGGETHILIGPATSLSVPWISPNLLTVLAAAYALSVLYFAARLARGLAHLHSVRRHAQPLTLASDPDRVLARLARVLNLGARPIHIAASPAISGPATVGVRRPTLLVPPGFLDQLQLPNLEALLAHELAHMRRGDFAKNLLYGLLSLPVAYHPALWMARARLDESRELVCDEIAAEAIGARETYARSLLRLASMLGGRARPAILHAVGILDANTFERRVMHLTHNRAVVAPSRRLLISACALLALAACSSALALRVEVAEEQSHAIPTKVKVADLKMVSHVFPVYPPQAKADKVSGTVILEAVIGKDGSVENIKVTKSVRDDCDQAAIDAVRQWKFKPYLLNGQPIEVKTDITVIYSLQK